MLYLNKIGSSNSSNGFIGASAAEAIRATRRRKDAGNVLNVIRAQYVYEVRHNWLCLNPVGDDHYKSCFIF
jgi:hypothetical protein